MMWLDGNKNPQGTTRENRNIKSTKDKKVENEKGTQRIGEIGICIGIIELNNNDSIHFYNNGTMYYFNEKGFQLKRQIIITDNPIHGVFHLNNKSERIITWTDGGKLQQTNIDQVEEEDLNSINVSIVPILNTKITEEGQLLSGTYYPIIQLLRKDKSTSQWYKHYNPVYITDDSINNTYEQYDGTPSNKRTNKAIRIFISNLDQKYDKVRIGYVQQIEGVKKAYYIKDIPIKEGVVNYTILGSELLNTITLDEVLVDPVKYNKVGLVTTFENSLYIADLGIRDEPNHQEKIDSYTINWYSEKVNVIQNEVVAGEFQPSDSKESYKYHEYNNQKRTFLHDEVYSFYIRYKYPWGHGKWFHVQGRLPKPSDLSIGFGLGTIGGYKPFQIFDTCKLLGNTINGIYGEMSYWENEQKENDTVIRHHKFPSHRWFKDNVYKDTDYGTRYLDALGIMINGVDLSLIKDSEGNTALDYEIGYSKRDNSNRVLGQSIVIKSVNKDSRDIITSLGVNMNIPDYNGNIEFNKKLIRTYPFEILKLKNKVNVNYIRTEYQLYTSQPRSLAIDNNEDLGITIVSNNDYTLFGKSYKAVELLTKTTNNFLVDNNTIPFTSLEDQKTIDSKVINNSFGETFYAIELKTELNIPVTTNIKGIQDRIPGSFYFIPNEPTVEYTNLITLLNIQKNYNVGYETRIVINCGNRENNLFFGGDGYICDYSVNTYGTLRRDYTDDIEKPKTKNSKVNGLRSVKRFLCEASYNINLRYIDSETNQYYPKSVPFNKTRKGYLQLLTTDIDPNTGGYNNDFHAQNDFETPIIFNQNEDNIVDYPYAVAKSDPLNNDTNIEAWRTFRPNNYYQVSRERGKIINLVGGQDFIYIHFRNSLFKTRGNEQLKTEGLNIFVGYGDIFQYEPTELIHDKLGSLGTQHKWSCNYTNKGYLFLDSDKGLLFLITDKINILSDRGLYNFFQENSSCNYDNPFTNFGFNTVYDEENSRILFTKKNRVLKPEDRNKFKGVWKEDQEFLSSLQSGDIVLKNGIYVRYI